MVLGPPKTHQHRSVVVPRSIREDLGRQLAGNAPADLVFDSLAGTPLRVQDFRRDRSDRAGDADAARAARTPI